MAVSVRFPGPPGVGLDESWQLVLGQALEHHLGFGRDLVFTFGPLGALENYVQIPSLFWPQIGWQLISRAVFMIVIANVTHRYSWRRMLTVWAWLLICGSSPIGIPAADMLPLTAIWAAGANLILQPERSIVVCALSAITLGALALVKFNLAVAGAGVAASAFVYLAVRRSWRTAFVAGVFPSATFIFGWLVSGQSAAGVIPYVTGSLEIARGYMSAMVLPTASTARWLAAAGVLVCFSSPLVGVARSRKLPSDKRVICLVTIGLAVLAFRHGTTRLDVFHASTFFAWIAIVALLITPVIADKTGDRGRATAHALTVLSAVAVALVWAWRTHGFDWWHNIRRDLSTAKLEAKLLISPERTHRHWSDRFKSDQAKFAVPEFARIVAQNTVDVHGIHQGIAILNGFAYAPRPIPQGYSAYTPALALRNARYLAAERPPYTIVDLQTIDGRIPTADDSLSLLWLLQHDRFVATAGDYVLLEYTNACSGESQPGHAIRSTIVADQWVTLNHPPNERVQFVTIDASYSALGEILRHEFPCPELRITVKFGDASLETYNLPIEMGRSGFVTVPFVHDSDALRRWLSGSALKRISAIRFEGAGRIPVYRATAEITVQSL